ncbi:MAG TPA: hypothetical protein PLB10_16460 [Thiolinea sp.]|nr:hypothetical protein [Thiolinea sp.]
MNKKSRSVFSVSDFYEPDEIFSQLPENIYYVGHRFEDAEKTEDILLELGELNPVCDGEFVFGKTNKIHLGFLIKFLSAKFISGYIVWFDSGTNISTNDFGCYFFKNRKKCFLTAIYKSTVANGVRSIKLPPPFEKNVLGLIMTDSGEQSFTVLWKQG